MGLLERGEALAALEECRREGGQIVLVAGEAGIGKTALITAFASTVEDRVLIGGCDALHTPRPLGPLRDIARAAGGELARVMAADWARYDRFSAFLDLLADGRTVVIEDAHWADEATLDLLVFAGRRIAGLSGLLIVSYRNDAIEPDHPLRGMLGSLAGTQTRRIELRPLSGAAIARLAQPCGMDPHELHMRTGGNPFFVTEVLGEPGPTVPATVRDAVLARVAGLGPDARLALDAAAVVPDRAELHILDGLDDLDGLRPGTARAAVDACVRAGMLVGEGTRVRFRHELARLAVEQVISPARRIALHATVLERLVARTESDPARLAHHAEEAGDGAAVLVYAPAAAERAAAAGAARQAADHYERALRFAGSLPPRELAELLERHEDACAAVDSNAAAIGSSHRALELWRRLGEIDRAAEVLARRSYYLWRNGDTDAAHASLREALAMLDPDTPSRALAVVLNWQAFLYMFERDLPAAIEIGLRAIALAELLGDQSLLACACNAVGSAEWLADPDGSEATLLQSLTVAQRAGDDIAASGAMVNLGSIAGELRHYGKAEHWLRETISWCERRDLGSQQYYALAWRARVLFEQGHWAEADELLAAVPPGCTTVSRIVALTARGRIHVRRGDPDGAALLDEVWELAVPTMNLQRLWPVAAGRAEAAYLSGRTADIPALVAETHELAVRLGHRWAAAELGYWLYRSGGRAPDGDTPFAMEAGGDWEGATREWERLGCRYEAALARTASPDITDVLAGLDRLQRLGARPAAELIARRLRSVGVDRRPRRATLAHPAGLTARELDVLDLLREGLRNADIAARLHIAEKTAGHHVSAILAKLGVASRQDAARWKDGHSLRQN
jgi:DNA-binding CsgD family transcriptional regulator/tetratricopeptide (TPR) repeat protein